jgi:hypothetical protein
MENAPLSEQYRLAADEWVDANSAANFLEETKSAVLSRMMAAYGDIAVSRAEMNVKASDAWMDHLKKILAAREKADRLRINVDYIKMRHSEWQSAEANNRAEMRL